MHNDFFLDVRIPFIGQSLIDRMEELCLSAISEQRFYVFNQYNSVEKFVNVEEHIPEIHNLVDRCRCKMNTIAMVLPPEFVMDIHMDVYYLESRKTAMLIPISPKSDIAPTLFWDKKDPGTDESPFLSIPWTRGEPKLLNVKPYWHNIINNEHWRIMFQMSFSLDYHDVVDLIYRNELFDGIDCVPAWK